jgi:DNA-binding NtrC family response regulator
MEIMGSETSGGGRILIVDDDQSVCRLLAAILEDSGYTTAQAPNGREAMALLESRPFDLVITDLVMPEQEGIETIKLLRRDFPELKVIAMSGAFGGDYLRIAGYLGAHQTLQKPISVDALLRAVGAALKPLSR